MRISDWSSDVCSSDLSALTANLDLIMDIPIDIEIVLGSSRMQVSGLMNLEEGATIALDRKIGEPVEIMVNGRRIGKGEITVLENDDTRSEEHTSELQSLMRISYAVFCLKKKNKKSDPRSNTEEKIITRD